MDLEYPPLPHVNLSLLAGKVGESPPNTPDRRHGEHDLLLAIHVGVEHTQNVLKALVCYERLQNIPANLSIRFVSEYWQECNTSTVSVLCLPCADAARRAMHPIPTKASRHSNTTLRC